MTAQSRRRFLIQSSRLGAAALTPAWGWRRAFANPLGRPIGIQLYTVNGPMREDPAGTLKKLREIGFGEVESAGFGKLSAKEFRRHLDDAGLACPSAHLQFDVDNLGPTFENAHALGAAYAASGSLPAPAVDGKPAPASSKRSMSLSARPRWSIASAKPPSGRVCNTFITITTSNSPIRVAEPLATTCCCEKANRSWSNSRSTAAG
jgi:hypothetical protein